MSFLLKHYSLLKVAHLFNRCNQVKFFLRNTNNTDTNGVNKQKTTTQHKQKDNIRKEGEGGSNYEPG